MRKKRSKYIRPPPSNKRTPKERKGKDTYIAFLDVTKAYDKAWADGIMYVMANQGIQDNTWTIIRKLNEGLTAVAETKHGKTREFKMKDNIR